MLVLIIWNPGVRSSFAAGRSRNVEKKVKEAQGKSGNVGRAYCRVDMSMALAVILPEVAHLFP